MRTEKSKIIPFEQGAARVRLMEGSKSSSGFEALALKAGFVKLSDMEFDLVTIYTRFMSTEGMKRLSLYAEALQKDFPAQVNDRVRESSVSLAKIPNSVNTEFEGFLGGLCEGGELDQVALIALSRGYTRLSSEEVELIRFRVRALSSKGVEHLMLLVKAVFPELCSPSQGVGL